MAVGANKSGSMRDGTQRVDSVEPLEVDGRHCYHLLAKLQLLAEGLSLSQKTFRQL